MFIGQQAKHFNHNNLVKAKEMQASGTTESSIFKETGLFQRLDGEWRQEISDKDAAIKLSYYKSNENGKDYITTIIEKDESNSNIGRVNFNESQDVKLYDVLRHDELFANYPELKDINVKLGYSTDRSWGGSFGNEPTFIPFVTEPVIRLNLNANIEDGDTADNSIKRLLLHEIQHYIQDKEGFDVGLNFSAFNDNKNAEHDHKDKILTHKQNRDEIVNQLGYNEKVVLNQESLNEHNLGDGYNRLTKYALSSGEVEARNTVYRSELTDYQRYMLPPYLTEEAPPAAQIAENQNVVTKFLFNQRIKDESINEDISSKNPLIKPRDRQTVNEPNVQSILNEQNKPFPLKESLATQEQTPQQQNISNPLKMR